MTNSDLWPIAVAIIIAAALFCATMYALGRAYIRSQQADLDDEAPHPPRDVAADDEDGEDEDDKDVIAFINSVRSGGPDAMMLAAWREEKRAEGLTDEEIDEILAKRPPILVT